MESDVQKRLDVRLLRLPPGERVGYTLDYHVDSPLNAILTPFAMQHYTQLCFLLKCKACGKLFVWVMEDPVTKYEYTHHTIHLDPLNEMTPFRQPT
jgi:hypothetical protein